MADSVTYRRVPTEEEAAAEKNYNPFVSGVFNDYPVYGEDEKEDTKPKRGSITTGGGYAPALTPTGQETISTWEASGKAPELGDMEPFEAPEWDSRKIARKTQVKAAPGVRKLRTAMQRVQARSYENPNVGAMTLREALGGYGLGLQGVMAGAESAAQAEYGREYGQQFQAKAMGYQANLQRQMAEYQAAYQSYLKEGTTSSTSTNIYNDYGDEYGEQPYNNSSNRYPRSNYYQRPNTSISVG